MSVQADGGELRSLLGSPSPAVEKKYFGLTRTQLGAATALVTLATIVTVVTVVELNDGNDSDTPVPLDTKITQESLTAHLEKFMQFATENSNSRSVALGFSATGDYVMETFHMLDPNHEKINCVKQPFSVPVHTVFENSALEMTQPIPIVFQYGQDFNQLRYGGSGSYSNIEGAVVYIAADGCDPAQWASFPAGGIALLQTALGTCEEYVKVYNAEQAGAIAVLLHAAAGVKGMPNPRIRAINWKEGDVLIEIPTFGVTFTAGNMLQLSINRTGPVARLSSNTKTDVYSTFNVLCDTLSGNEDHTVVVGAHGDSVPEGPGIVDNGSGSAAILEIAVQLISSDYKLRNKVRFAWWGAEEIGLLGSRHYVADLQENNPAELARIRLALNFDMIASPNFVRLLLDGNSAPVDSARAPSVAIMKLFEAFFDESNIAYELLDFSFGRSDFVPFAEAGIPAGGLFTGADALKTADQRLKFGGWANAALDPCYHLPCDTIENVDWPVMMQLTRAAAYVVEYYTVIADLQV
eukprot:TRINITY_DN2466_c0_g1_i1.p1 TRINITY_DN2466_c0_g1~~TRINITY_DN2466_c0_g1_i1.p1  ORF type:complete len:536 (-),score=151.05 TRINITY_DN2466_c0_g1_i1:47-1615(-)